MSKLTSTALYGALALSIFGCSDSGLNRQKNEDIGAVQERSVCTTDTFRFQLNGSTSNSPLQLYGNLMYGTACFGQPLDWFQVPSAPNALAPGNNDAVTGPGAISLKVFGVRRTDVFYVGTANTLVHVFEGSNGWQTDDWGAPANFNIYGNVGVTSWGDNRIDVFVLAKIGALTASNDDVTRSLYHIYWDNGASQGWQQVGLAPAHSGNLFSKGVTAISRNIGSIDVFGNTANNVGLQHWSCASTVSCNATSWASSTWPTVDAVYSVPNVASHCTGCLDIFYMNSLGHAKQAWLSGEADWGVTCGGNYSVGASTLVGAYGVPSLNLLFVQAACAAATQATRDMFVSRYWGGAVSGWTYVGASTPLSLWPDANRGAGVMVLQ